MEDGKYQRRRNVDISRTLLLILVCCYSTMSLPEYKWETGKWSTCKHEWCGNGGTATRTVHCVGMDGRKVESRKCGYFEKPKSSRECYLPCEHHKHRFKWDVGSWGKCISLSKSKDCRMKYGIQNRLVTCIYLKSPNHETETDDVCAFFFPKPSTEQSCRVSCPQDCITTEFSEWSSCDKCAFLNRTRTRTVVVPPSKGGKTCPNLSEMEPCLTCQDSYTFSIGPWGKCKKIYSKDIMHMEKLHHHIGYQEREITCLGIHGRIVPPKHCMNIETMHADYQSCVLPQDCEVSAWDEWEPYSKGCQSVDGVIYKPHEIKRRRIEKMPLGDGAKCPNLEEIREINMNASSLPRCPVHKWVASDYGPCKPSVTARCGPGLQQRTVICIEKSYKHSQIPVAESNCNDVKPNMTKVCHIECRQSCLASEWSTWSKCKPISCIEDKIHRKKRHQYTGYRSRTLQIVSTSHGTGGGCIPVIETQPCDPGPCYSWNLTSSGICYLDRSERMCGQGTKHNQLSCVDVNGVPKDESLCDSYSRPSDKESCRIPCPSDCVLSEWSTWTKCPDECDKKAQTINRVRRRRILAFPGASGPPCPSTSSLTESSPCPSRLECRTFSWVALDWDPCVLAPGVTCGTGTQTRKILCKSEGREVEDSWCVRHIRPDDIQPCQLPCPRDCVVTDYSHWTPCSATCQEMRQAAPTQVRKKYIIQPADEGGKPCPTKLIDIKHCTDLPWCDVYVWELTEWSACVAPPRSPSCGQALRGRNVTCRDQRHNYYAPDVCLEYVGPMPDVAEPCFVPCSEKCLLTEWGPFSSCINGCNGYKFRHRELKDQSKFFTECKNRLRYPLYEKVHCKCDPFQPITIGNLSECIIEGPKVQSSTEEAESFDMSNCGEGKAYKALLCLNSNDILKGTSQCSDAGQNPCCNPYHYKFEPCTVPCPVDCIMSQWSTWSPCNASCGYGFQERYRTIEQKPSSGGRPCPIRNANTAQTQTKLCKTNCKEYVWRHDGWSTCVYRSSYTCGMGIQTRQVICVEEDNFFGITSLQDSFCSRSPKPEDQRTCSTPCVGECVVSEWSEWSKCSFPCILDEFQTRNRKVLRAPDRYKKNNNGCPELLERRKCNNGISCREFTWRASNWSSCLVKEGTESWGIGKRERYVTCVDHYGNPQRSHLCYEVAGKPTFNLQEFCEIPQNIDCLLSSWSSWGPCSKACGLGTSQRQRYILREPVAFGRPCARQLIQRKPCVLRGCFRWDVTEWTDCFSEKGVCGHGVQTRNITCFGEGRTQVDESFCKSNRSIVTIQTKKTCYVGCPGECVLTIWSQWSECYAANCPEKADFLSVGHERGVQSRSRAVLAYPASRSDPCSKKLYESRPCHAENCYTFQWNYSKWNMKRRAVWCERSDSLKVTGACEEKSYPGNVLTCDPPCSRINGSECVDVNVCQCLPSYEPEYQNNILISCGAIVTTNTPVQTTTRENRSHVKRSGMSIWMYAVIGGGTLAVAGLTYFFYAICGMFRKGPRERDNRSQGQDTQSQHISIDEQTVQCNHVQAFVEAQQENNENAAAEHKTCNVGSPSLPRGNNIHEIKCV